MNDYNPVHDTMREILTKADKAGVLIHHIDLIEPGVFRFRWKGSMTAIEGTATMMDFLDLVISSVSEPMSSANEPSVSHE
jgi:hypothetical protein